MRLCLGSKVLLALVGLVVEIDQLNPGLKLGVTP